MTFVPDQSKTILGGLHRSDEQRFLEAAGDATAAREITLRADGVPSDATNLALRSSASAITTCNARALSSPTRRATHISRLLR